MDGIWANYWAKTRTQGPVMFVAVRGCTLGAIMFLLLVMLPRWFHMVDPSASPLPALVGFLALGFAVAYALWWANERSYRRLQAQPPKPPRAPQ